MREGRKLNSDIRILVSFKGHRKRRHLEQLLNSIGATRYLVDLWLTAAQQRPDGNLKGWSVKDIAEAAGYSGEPQRFVDNLVESGFLDHASDSYRLHDWAQHQPWCCNAEERREHARKAAAGRWPGARQGPEQGRPGVGGGVAGGRPGVGAEKNFSSGSLADRTAEPSSECESHAPSIIEHEPNSDTNNAPILSLPLLTLPAPPLPPAASAAYDNFLKAHGGHLNQILAEEIGRLIDTFGDQNVADAIREAVKSNQPRPSINYLESILTRWEKEGKSGKAEPAFHRELYPEL